MSRHPAVCKYEIYQTTHSAAYDPCEQIIQQTIMQKERNDYNRSFPFASFSIDDIRLKSVAYRDMRCIWVAASRGKLT